MSAENIVGDLLERFLKLIPYSVAEPPVREEGYAPNWSLGFRREGWDDGRLKLHAPRCGNPTTPASRWGAWTPAASATRLLLLQLLSRQLLSILLKNSSQIGRAHV